MKFLNTILIIFLLLFLMTKAGASGLESIVRIDDERWLLVSETDGLKLVNNQQKLIALYPGSFEQADSRLISTNNGENHHLVYAVNKKNNTLDMHIINNDSMQLIKIHQYKSNALESICLYLDRSSQLLYAFVILDNLPIEQKLIYDLERAEAIDVKVRDIPIQQGLSSCAADDYSDSLYVAEESVGVWRYSARPESEPDRFPVAMKSPFGQLTERIHSVKTLSDGSLLIGQTNANQLAFYQPSFDRALLASYQGSIDEVFGASWKTPNSIQIISDSNLKRQKEIVLNKLKPQDLAYQKFKQVRPSVETQPMKRFGDAADDPAIWVNHANPRQSLILATDKKRGLASYSLGGQTRQFLPVGRLNNVDLRYNFKLSNKIVSLAAASNRDNNSISFFSINELGNLDYLNDVATTLSEVYGICMSHEPDKNQFFVFINDKDGRYQQFLVGEEKGKISAKKVNEFRLIDQPEGCVANDKTQELFVGVEDHGVWHGRISGNIQLEKIITLSERVVADIEGLGLYQNGTSSYLVVSSQGNDSYAIFRASWPFDYIDSVRIAANLEQGIDGASETDGLEVTSANLGGVYSQGLLVVQDGRNIMPVEPQNFKLVPFSEILQQLAATAESETVQAN